ncbi:hypothetical protein F5I97DRAFT_1803192 [Phlebopus sp. FC_14]|nr:hypothetical protein F5I97DRAFT_1803192 [Phlebopus sp. FC_14]
MSEPPILNPGVYLNYLSPQTAAEYEVFRNVHIATLGAYIWDMLSSSSQEFKMMRTTGSRVTVNFVAYWIARYVLFLLVDPLFTIQHEEPGPMTHCQGHILGVDTTYILAGAASSFMFLRRVQAVFFKNRVVRWCFAVLWIANVIIGCIMPMGTTASEIANTKHCIVTGEPSYIAAGCISSLVYDSLVFLAVSYKVNTSYSLDRNPLNWKTFFSRPRSPRLSKSIMQGGQQYYLASVFANIIASLLLLIQTVPLAYRILLMLPVLALTTSMACRVFRHLFLEEIEQEGGSGHGNLGALTTVIDQISGEQVTLPCNPGQGVSHSVV